MEAEEAESSTPQSSVVSSVVVVEDKRVEKTAEASRTRYLEKVKELDLEDLECRRELAEVLGLKSSCEACVTRGLESTPVHRLVKGPRSTFLKSKNDEDS